MLMLASTSQAFVPSSIQRPSRMKLYSDLGGPDLGNLVTLEYKIYPDGRVEEVVRGIKGAGCHELTKKIHENLGKVISSEPTEEFWEEEIALKETLIETVGEGDQWEGKSSW
jgi:hypothetical protein